jgi:hypothetical protein
MAMQPSGPAPLPLSFNSATPFHSKEEMVLSKESRSLSLDVNHLEHDADDAHQRSDTQIVSGTSLQQ